MSVRQRRRPQAQAMDARIRARRDQVLGDRARRRRRLTSSVVTLALLAGGGFALASSGLFAIDDVRVLGTEAHEAEAVRAAAGLRAGDNLLRADLDAVAARVEELAWVHHAEVRRIPPSSVEVRVGRRTPVAVVRLNGAGWLVDADGILVAGGVSEGLVDIVAPNSVVPAVGGHVADAALSNALDVHAQLPAALRARVLSYEAPSARDLRLHLIGGVVVRFGVAERVADKARSVELLLDQARTQEERSGAAVPIAEIDVRAPDNPVFVPAHGAATTADDDA